MVSAVAVLCLVAGLLEGAFSLNCYHCNSNVTDCNMDPKPCQNGTDVCIATITEISTQGQVTKVVERACGYKNMCNTNYSMSIKTTNLYATIRCCDKDKCTIPVLDVQKSTNKNDLECLTCNERNGACKNPIKIKCTGDEKKCVTYTAKETSTKDKYISKGCATENVCKMDNITVLPFNQILMTKFDCTNHAPSLLPALFFPIAIVIALLKLLS